MNNFFNKILQHKYWWLAIIILFVGVTYISSLFRYRIDLTAEKRFTLSEPTKKLLKDVDTAVNIKVFLTGDLPADYKKLNASVDDILREFRELSGNYVQYEFEKPGEDINDSAKHLLLKKYLEANKDLNDNNRSIVYDSILRNKESLNDIISNIVSDSLSRLGVVFERSEDVASSEKSTNQLIIPSALVYYKDQKPFAIDLRSSRTVFKNFNVVNDQPQEDKEATRNAAEALLEFKFANAIDKLTRKYVPTVAYVIGNGEASPSKVTDLGKSLSEQYTLGVFDLKSAYPNPDQIDVLVIVKPTQPFTEEDKLKLDQYIMHGGKIVWCIDKLYAELDSLMRSQADFVAFDRNLNIDDILFKYGVRINSDLLQDLDCSKIPIVIGYNPDNSPRMQRLPWPYYPFLTANNNNPISKNLDRVLPIFPSSIDTVKAPGISKTILLTSDTNSRILSSPALVSLNTVQTDEDFQMFNKSYVPVSVLLQGKFTSLFANRLNQQIQDSVTRSSGKPFAAQGIKETKQIVMADADIVTNAVSPTTGPLPMGMLPLENYRFANREFFLNSIDYLVSNSGIFEARNKDFTLRLLDKKKVEEQRTTWQLINIVAPVALILLFGVLFQWHRKNRYSI